jgi:uncharacterized protein DUF6894
VFKQEDGDERYYFHVDAGASMAIDRDGRELSSLQEALDQAMALADELEAQGGDARRTVVVEDESGEEIARVLVGFSKE